MQQMPRSWIFFPDFTAGSPYQTRLAETLAPYGWAVRPGDIAAAILAARTAPAVFHLHWEQPVYVAAADEAGAFALTQDFLRALDAFRAAGGFLVWTLHNASPHEERFPAVNMAMQQGLAQRADLVHRAQSRRCGARSDAGSLGGLHPAVAPSQLRRNLPRRHHRSRRAPLSRTRRRRRGVHLLRCDARLQGPCLA